MIGVTNSDKDLVESTTPVLYNSYKASGFETIGHFGTCKKDMDGTKKSPCVAAGANGGWMRGLCVPFK